MANKISGRVNYANERGYLKWVFKFFDWWGSLKTHRRIITALIPFCFAIAFPFFLVAYEDTAWFNYWRSKCEEYEKEKKERIEKAAEKPKKEAVSKDTFSIDTTKYVPPAPKSTKNR
jgi:hypothetical protein